MRFVFGKQDTYTLEKAQEHCFLLTNGLGGFASLTKAFSVNRGDQGILISAKTAPCLRYLLVQRLKETVRLGEKEFFLSTQEFADQKEAERGYENLTSFVWEDGPEWLYEKNGLEIRRSMTMKKEANVTAILYRFHNASDQPCRFTAEPGIVCLEKGQVHKKPVPVTYLPSEIQCQGQSIFLRSNGSVKPITPYWESLAFSEDGPEGRNEKGLNGYCLQIAFEVLPGQDRDLEILFSDHRLDETIHAFCLLRDRRDYYSAFEKEIPFHDPTAVQLAKSALAFLVNRDSTQGKTIIAGYPFFGDWGRDTMIALPGCVLACGQMAEARSILRTFLHYEKDGLVPNLFPEGDQPPMYNTVDAALLLINCVWLYYQKSKDKAFVREAWPVLKRIIAGYQQGTHHSIRMEEDGLISAGGGLDQVTWMDVCVEGILPTPRHGKPVEVNAYWYNALKIMAEFSRLVQEEEDSYRKLAEKVRESFQKEFWMPEKGYLKDVVSQTAADKQLRCNQIWAVTMPFSLLTGEQEKMVVDTILRELYTPCGLRTLSPRDEQFHPHYGGKQKERDLAYHQGTVWIFPLGAFYRAYLKVHEYSGEARTWVSRRLESLLPMLREGCIGQLPEIYEGLLPGSSKGCFAQAWSVGEMLTVYEEVERLQALAEADKYRELDTDAYQNYIFDLYETLVDIRTDEEKASLWEEMAKEYSPYGLISDPVLLKKRYQELVAEEEEKMKAEMQKLHPENAIFLPEIQLEKVFCRLLKENAASGECPADVLTVTCDQLLIREMGKRFRELSMIRIGLYPGARELLETLRKKGKRIWLLSNAQRLFTEAELKNLGIYDLFDGIYISSDWGCKKPDPSFFKTLLEKEKIDPGKAIMIGNDPFCDIFGARLAGISAFMVK